MAEKASIIISAEDRTKQAFASVQANLRGLTAGAASLSASFAGVAAGITAGLAGVQFKSIIDGLDALNDAADATGSTIENLSALEDIALRTGTSFDTVTGALVKFNQSLNAADPDSKAARALQAIGLSAEELKRLDPSEALLRTATALSGFADDGNKARLVQELFGKSIREVAPLLKDLAEKGELVAKATTAQAQEAERFNKRLAELQKNSLDAARALTSDLLPALSTFAERLAGLRVAGGFFPSIGKEFKANLLTDELRTAVNDLEALQGRVNAGEKGLDRQRNALRAYISDIQRQLLKATDDLKGFANLAAPPTPRGRPANEGGGKFIAPSVAVPDDRPGPRAKPAKPDNPFVGPAEFGPLQDAIKRLEQTDLARVTRLREELAQLLTIGSSDPRAAQAIRQVSDAIESLDPVGPEVPAQLKATFDVLAQTDVAKAEKLNAVLTELLTLSPTAGTAEAVARLRKEIQDLNPEARRLNELLAATPSAEMERARADMQLLADAFERGEISAEQFGEAATKRLGNDLTKNARTAADEIEAVFERAFGGLADGLASFVTGGKSDFKSLGDAIIKELVRVSIQAQLLRARDAAANAGGLLGAIAGLFGGGTGAGVVAGGTGLLASAKGNVFSNAPGLSAYSNTVVSSPTVFPFAKGVGLMGEAGDEAILPLKRMAGGDLGVAAAVSASSAPTIFNLVNQSSVPLVVKADRQESDNERSLILADQIEARLIARTNDPNSKFSKSLTRNLRVERQRP